MQYGEFNTSQAVGVRLCRNVTLAGKHYTKGHTLTYEDTLLLKSYGIRRVFGVIFEDGDIDYRTAAAYVAARLCGAGLGYFVDRDGICKIAAAGDGVFMADENRLDKFNGFNEHFILNTIAPYGIVKSGDIIAELEVTPTLLDEAEIGDMLFRLSGNDALLSVSGINAGKATLVYTHLLEDEDENRLFTSVVMKLITNLEGLGIEFDREINSRYDKDVLADSLFDAYQNHPEVIFVLSPLSSSGCNNVLQTGLTMAADEVINLSYPQVGASDLLIARKGKTKIIVIPHSYDRADTSGIDAMIKHALFTENPTAASFMHKRSGWLSYTAPLPDEDFGKLIMPSVKSSSADKASVAVVVLAAGQGRRAGTNKLMAEDKNGKPLFLRAVNAAISSEAQPVFVVTGYRHEEMEEWLDKLDINVIYNPSYAAGIKTSISTGLKSVPSSCDGAILLPADMPNITASDLNRLIGRFDKKAERQLCLMVNKGIKNNPVLWSRSLYEQAELVPENAQMRAVFVEHADYTKTVEIRDAKKLLDVTYPNDIGEFSAG